MKVRIINKVGYELLDGIDKPVEAKYQKGGYQCLFFDANQNEKWLFFPEEFVEIIHPAALKVDQHYNNENGSLYLFAQQHNLNAYEFDCIKRIVRCRKKGQFKEDLEKTKRVIDLYLKEFEV